MTCNFHSGMTRAEFLDWLHYSAVAGGMPPQFFDRVADLRATEDLEAAIEKLEGELAQAEKDRDDLYCELEDLREAVADQNELDPASMSENLQAALKWADKALERHAND